MNLLPWIFGFGGGIVFTILLELQGLSELLAPVRQVLTVVSGT